MSPTPLGVRASGTQRSRHMRARPPAEPLHPVLPNATEKPGLANQPEKTRKFQRGVLDHDCMTMLCFKVVLQLIFFFFKLA